MLPETSFPTKPNDLVTGRRAQIVCVENLRLAVFPLLGKPPPPPPHPEGINSSLRLVDSAVDQGGSAGRSVHTIDLSATHVHHPSLHMHEFVCRVSSVHRDG